MYVIIYIPDGVKEVAGEFVPKLKYYPRYYHHIFIYDGRDKNTNSQTKGSIKYISNTHGGVKQN